MNSAQSWKSGNGLVQETERGESYIDFSIKKPRALKATIFKYETYN